MIEDAVKSHYIRHWGKPSREAQYNISGYPIEVYKWDAGVPSNPEEVTLYGTVGASTQPITGMEKNHRIELHLGFMPPNDAIALPLAMLAAHPRIYRVTLDHGHTVSFPEPLWPGTEIHTMLVVRNVDEIMPTLRMADGTHVEFLQALPVYSTELEFLRRHGVDSLLEHWQRHDVPFWNPGRRPEPP